jgi:uncharacterized protein (DUF1330 family)
MQTSFAGGPGFGDAIVNNNKIEQTTNNRGYDRPPKDATRVVHMSQFLSFNFPSALISAFGQALVETTDNCSYERSPRGSFRSGPAARISALFFASNMTTTAASFVRQSSRWSEPISLALGGRGSRHMHPRGQLERKSPIQALAYTRQSSVDLSESCQRGVPKSRALAAALMPSAGTFASREPKLRAGAGQHPWMLQVRALVVARQPIGRPKENTMNRHVTLGLAMFAGAAFGATAIKGLSAQTPAKPPTYVVIDIAEMTNPEGFKAVLTSTAASPARLAALGGRYLIRTDAAVALDGTPPKRLVLLAFDSKEKAQAWYDAPDIKEINAIRAKTSKSNTFIVEGYAN